MDVLAIVGSGLGFEGSASGTEVGPCPSSTFVSPGTDTLTAVSSAPDVLFSWAEVEEEAIVGRIREAGVIKVDNERAGSRLQRITMSVRTRAA